MAQGNYTLDQTPLLASDYITRAQMEDTAYWKTGVDFYAAHKSALASYSKSYAGNYYRKMSAFTAFSAVKKAGMNVSIYEESAPTDVQDQGVLSVNITKATTGDLVDMTKIQNVDSESTWDFTSANTTTVYWRQEGTKLRFAIPNSFTGSVNFTWCADYKRLPTFPQIAGDNIDVPAEDEATYYAQWKNQIRIP